MYPDCQKGGHYFFTVKDNQPTLKQDIAAIWESEPCSPPQTVQVNKHGDRVEERKLWVSDLIASYSDWPYQSQVCRLERTTTRNGKTRHEVAYAVTSLSARQCRPKRLLALWRGHWGIENRLHWVRDVTFDEDRCQIRSGSAPQVMAAVRNTVIGLLRLAGNNRIAEALRRCAARPFDAIRLLKTRLAHKH